MKPTFGGTLEKKYFARNAPSVPYMFKSYHSITVPIEEAKMTFRSSAVIPPVRTSPAVTAIAIVHSQKCLMLSVPMHRTDQIGSWG